jgi:antitoxin component of MazEF toxin-antitoxin module
MKKIIKAYGNTNVIVLTAEEMKVYGLNIDDVIDVQLNKEGLENEKDIAKAKKKG